MENTLFRKDYLRTALQFTYNLPWDLKVKAMKDTTIKMISVYCKPDFEDNLQFSYSLLNDKVGDLFFDAFNDTPISNASALKMDEVEMILRSRIAEGLCGTSALRLKRSTLHAVCGYHIPAKIAGAENVRLLLKCFSPRTNEYRAQTDLYIKGCEIGTIDDRTVYGVDMTFHSFCERADIIAETILEDNFPATLEQMVHAKGNAKSRADTPDCK
ncbi:MAG: hypothetical protein RR234_05125 [Christensenella sp.]